MAGKDPGIEQADAMAVFDQVQIQDENSDVQSDLVGSPASPRTLSPQCSSVGSGQVRRFSYPVVPDRNIFSSVRPIAKGWTLNSTKSSSVNPTCF